MTTVKTPVAFYTLQHNTLKLNHGDVPEVHKEYTTHDKPDELKPREKLLEYGPSIMAVNELLAIVLSVGTRKESVHDMTARIMKEYGQRTLTTYTNPKKMAKDLDIPRGKALQIVACAELGKRFFKVSGNGLRMLRTAKDVFEYTKDMRDLPREHLRGLYLNAHHKVIHDEVISMGTINANIIHPREVFQPAIEYLAAAVILVHNHPSGVPEPSRADVTTTRQLVAAGKILGIDLLDHVIVTKEGFKSVDVVYDDA